MGSAQLITRSSPHAVVGSAQLITKSSPHAVVGSRQLITRSSPHAVVASATDHVIGGRELRASSLRH